MIAFLLVYLQTLTLSGTTEELTHFFHKLLPFTRFICTFSLLRIDPTHANRIEYYFIVIETFNIYKDLDNNETII